MFEIESRSATDTEKFPHLRITCSGDMETENETENSFLDFFCAHHIEMVWVEDEGHVIKVTEGE